MRLLIIDKPKFIDRQSTFLGQSITKDMNALDNKTRFDVSAADNTSRERTNKASNASSEVIASRNEAGQNSRQASAIVSQEKMKGQDIQIESRRIDLSEQQHNLAIQQFNRPYNELTAEQKSDFDYRNKALAVQIKDNEAQRNTNIKIAEIQAKASGGGEGAIVSEATKYFIEREGWKPDSIDPNVFVNANGARMTFKEILAKQNNSITANGDITASANIALNGGAGNDLNDVSTYLSAVPGSQSSKDVHAQKLLSYVPDFVEKLNNALTVTDAGADGVFRVNQQKTQLNQKLAGALYQQAIEKIKLFEQKDPPISIDVSSSGVKMNIANPVFARNSVNAMSKKMGILFQPGSTQSAINNKFSINPASDLRTGFFSNATSLAIPNDVKFHGQRLLDPKSPQTAESFLFSLALKTYKDTITDVGFSKRLTENPRTDNKDDMDHFVSQFQTNLAGVAANNDFNIKQFGFKGEQGDVKYSVNDAKKFLTDYGFMDTKSTTNTPLLMPGQLVLPK
jgi:hypothetical protein